MLATTYKALRVFAKRSYRRLWLSLVRLPGIPFSTVLFHNDGGVLGLNEDKPNKNTDVSGLNGDTVLKGRAIKPVGDTSFFGKSDFMDLNFLPIVTVSQKTVKDQNQQKDLFGESCALSRSVEAMKTEMEPLSKKNTSLPVALNFLPIIVDTVKETVSNSDAGKRYKYDPSLKDMEAALIKNLYVVYGEYGLSPHGQEDSSGEDMEKAVKAKEKIPKKTPLSVGDIDHGSLYQYKVSYELVDAISHTVWEAEEPIIDNKEEREVYENREGEPMLNFLLKPIFLDDHEQSLNQTLDDLEEMGDEREIPLLLEYLEHQKNDMLRERIHELLKKFVRWEPKPKNNTANSATEIFLPEYNVIRELFHSCDLEAQIILLDSVADVTDKDDAGFLEELLDHPDPEIKKKAKKGLFMLTERLKLGDDGASGNHRNGAYGKMGNAASFIEGPVEDENPFDFELDLFHRPNDNAPTGIDQEQTSRNGSILRESKHILHKMLKKFGA